MTARRPRVLLVGGYPPPQGGITVHVERLAALLRSAYDVDVLDLHGAERSLGDPPFVHRCRPRHPFDCGRAWARLAQPGIDVVHVHVSAMSAFAIAGPAIMRSIDRSSMKLLTVHSGSFARAQKRAGHLRRALARSLLRSFDRIVVVNDEQREVLGALDVAPERVVVMPAFLPPVCGEPPPELRELRAGCDRLVVASGYGLPYYGFATLLDALEPLDAAQRVGAALFLYGTSDEEYVRALAARLSTARGALFRNRSAAEFVGALALADTYVRATDRDGDAVAIREAAAVGARVVASDAVPRPPGCALFRHGDPDSLRAALRRVWTDERAGRMDHRAPDGGEILALYREMLATRRVRVSA